MEGLIINLDISPGQTTNLTVYSDLHTESQACAVNLLDAHMKRRATLPNSYFACIGDIGNWIMPGDKRHQASTPIPEIASQDAYVTATIDYQYELLHDYNWLWLGTGNHETSMLKYHGTDVVKFLLDRLGVTEGGYSGFARLRWHLHGKCVCTSTLLYHHGAWGGVATKGIIGAERYAASHDGWDVFVFGHNHHCHVHHNSKLYMTQNGVIKHRDCYIVNTGTFQLSSRQGGSPQYSEIRGYQPVAITAPLIKFTHRRGADDSHTMGISIETGDC